MEVVALCEACVRRDTPGRWWVRAREGGERAGGAHLSAHFAKLGSRRSKGLALADNRSLEHDNLRGPLVQLGMRLSNLSLSERGVPDAGKALRAPGNGITAAPASWGLGPTLEVVVHGDFGQKTAVSNQKTERGQLRSEEIRMISTASFFFGRTRMALTEGEGVSCAAVLLVRLAPPLPALHPGKRGG